MKGGGGGVRSLVRLPQFNPLAFAVWDLVPLQGLSKWLEMASSVRFLVCVRDIFLNCKSVGPCCVNSKSVVSTF